MYNYYFRSHQLFDEFFKTAKDKTLIVAFGLNNGSVHVQLADFGQNDEIFTKCEMITGYEFDIKYQSAIESFTNL